MCGRYALFSRPGEVRQRLQDAHMPVNDAPEDDAVRQTYNFAPGYHGLVYRADGPDQGGSYAADGQRRSGEVEDGGKTEQASSPAGKLDETQYKLQSMKWGLIPFWTKRNPDYGSMMKTINCRDDSLYEDRGMWTSMKKKKRCIVIAEGFYEWLKKNNGKEKIPHFTKRKDGQLMCFAGLWDCVKYDDSDEKHFTYTIITTDSNSQLKFLHDRMPVILENGSEAVRTWLDPNRTEWSKELQSLLKPFEGQLECYPVSKDVGKVGNNSPTFVVPIDSKENKNNIANFFGNQRKAVKGKKDEEAVENSEQALEEGSEMSKGPKVEHNVNETRGTMDQVEGTDDTENNAPLPVPGQSRGIKRERSEGGDGDGGTADGVAQQKLKTSSASPQKNASVKSARSPVKKALRATRSATSNGNAGKGSPAKGDGSRKITSFFGNK